MGHPPTRANMRVAGAKAHVEDDSYAALKGPSSPRTRP
jgi:hypothetical protein